MRSTLLTVALAAVSLFAIGGTALAQDVPGVPPPAFAPPTPAPVVDNDSAGAFAKLYAAQHAGDFLARTAARARRRRAEPRA